MKFLKLKINIIIDYSFQKNNQTKILKKKLKIC